MNLESLKAQWGELPEWQKILVVLLFSVLLLYGIYTVLIQSKLTEKKNLQDEVQSLQLQVERLKRAARPEIRKKLEEKYTTVQKEIEQLNKQLERLKGIVPPQEDIQYILSFISSSVFKSKMTLNSFKVSKTEDIFLRYNKLEDRLEMLSPSKGKKVKSAVNMKRIIISLDMVGEVSELIKFIKNLSKSERYLRIDKVVIERAKKTGRKKQPANMLQISMVVSTYYLPEEK
ncbi:GspMb/PilO family protein [Persephonella sp.]